MSHSLTLTKLFPHKYYLNKRSPTPTQNEKQKLGDSLEGKGRQVKMPRPGPRPYECLKKAWHSDRHQPMRGSLIQEIFRVVNEIHTAQTKKNKEWQEKLPVVVLKAEEIIYSKANSEAEYMDLATLWERTNDAIDTIIRKEDTTETGDLLQPCIEAALILGCTARRASRSQRNVNPRSYLQSTTQETAPPHPHPPPLPASPNVARGESSRLPHLQINKPASTPAVTPFYSSTSTTISIPMNSSQLPWESGSHRPDHYNPTTSPVFPFSSQNVSQSAINQVHLMEFPQLDNLGRVYPLYYGAQNQSIDPQVVLQIPYGVHSSSAPPGVSQAHCVRQSNENVVLQKFFSCDSVVNTSSRNPETDSRMKAVNPPNIECDLSLSLGSLSVPFQSRDSKCAYEVEDNRSTNSQQGNSCYLYPKTSKELCFFPRENANEPLESSSSKWSSIGEGTDLDGSSRKRKAPANELIEASHVSNNPKLLTDLFFDRMKKPDK